jgi:hypothetical protein
MVLESVVEGVTGVIWCSVMWRSNWRMEVVLAVMLQGMIGWAVVEDATGSGQLGGFWGLSSGTPAVARQQVSGWENVTQASLLGLLLEPSSPEVRVLGMGAVTVITTGENLSMMTTGENLSMECVEGAMGDGMQGWSLATVGMEGASPGVRLAPPLEYWGGLEYVMCMLLVMMSAVLVFVCAAVWVKRREIVGVCRFLTHASEVRASVTVV